MTATLLHISLLLAASTSGIVAAWLLVSMARARSHAGRPQHGPWVTRTLLAAATVTGLLSLFLLVRPGSPISGSVLAVVAAALASTSAALAGTLLRVREPEATVPDDLAAVVQQRIRGLEDAKPSPVVNSRLADLLLEGSADALGGPFPTDPEEFDSRLMHANRLQSIGRLAGGIVHDFNNLLTSILTSAELAQEALPAEHGAAPDLAEIRRAGTRASELTRQLLSFARRDASRPRVLDMNTLVGNLAMMLRRVLGETITLRLTLASDLPLVYVDSAQMEQVIVNLAVNARDAMPAGGELELRTRRARPNDWPGTDAPPWGVMLDVRDTGVGMPSEVRERIFEPFFTTKAPGRGTGLGLATCHGIVIAHGGEITVESVPNEGSTLHVWLPPTEELEEGRTSGGYVTRAPADATRQRRVLFVEDDADVRHSTVRALRAAGYAVLEASDGRDALALVSSEAGPIDLVIADVVMPHMGGVELVRRLREDWPEIQALFTSGYPGDSPDVAEAEAMGDPVLAKPFTPSILLFEARLRLDSVRPA